MFAIEKKTRIFVTVMAFAALSQGLFDGTLSNYMHDVYNIGGLYRGLIEAPREIPGLLCIIFISLLGAKSDTNTAFVSQLIAAAGMLFLGFFTPPFGVMLLVMFLHSAGTHVFLPMQDSIAVKLSGENNPGRKMGGFKCVTIIFIMLANLVIFFGFRLNVFSFITPVKPVLVLCGLCALVSAFFLKRLKGQESININKPKKLFKKQYSFFYLLTALRGTQKHTLLVFGPWVFIEVLGKGADYIALLMLTGSFLGIFFTPLIGRLTDTYGIKKMLYVDALLYIINYTMFGFTTWGFLTGRLSSFGLPVFIASFVLILDNMCAQAGMVRIVYLNSIIEDPSDLTPAISLGYSFDHIISITFSLLGGIMWATLGGQYIFFYMAGLSLINLFVVYRVKILKKYG